MRALFPLIAGLTLFLGACSDQKGGGRRVPPPPLPHKEYLAGKWNNRAVLQFLAGYEFDKDGNVKVMFKEMNESIPAHYRWTDDRTLEMEYPKDAEVQKTYEAAAKAYKEWIKQRMNKGELDDRSGPSLMKLVAEKLPDKDLFNVGLNEPRFLILARKNGFATEFDKAD